MSLQTRRTGLIAKKVGMTQIFTEDGAAIAVTLLKADENFVIANRKKDKDGYTALVVGAGVVSGKNINKPQKAQLSKADLPMLQVIKEFRVSEDALVAVGSQLSVNHFVAEQLVDVHGVNIGKGFAGPMKRWNFRGLEATHGVSISHRSHGSTGQRQDPGKTFKGKKMAGHMGCESVTIQNLQIVMIDPELGIIAINGSVPGRKGSYVTITDAVKMSLPAGVAYPAALVSKSKSEVTAAAQTEQVQEESKE